MKLLSCAVLLLPLLFTGVGEAKDSPVICFKGVTVLANAPQTMREVPCNGAHDLLVDVSKATITQHSTCYDKMREAMKAVSPFLSKTGDMTSVEAVYIPPSARLRQEADAIDREDAAVQQFRDVMKECIQ